MVTIEQEEKERKEKIKKENKKEKKKEDNIRREERLKPLIFCRLFGRFFNDLLKRYRLRSVSY